jgi:hypothetical protein
MISSRCFDFRARLAAFCALAAAAAALSIFSCSEDPANTLGSDSDLLPGGPGEVQQDTIGVYDDTVYTMNTPIAEGTELELGMDSLYTRAMILQPSFSGLTQAMKNAAVLGVDLRLPPVDVPGNFPVRFYEYGERYDEGEEVDITGLANAIVDPGTGLVDRTIEFADARHALDPVLVKTWIDVDTTREAIVIEYTDAINERLAKFVAVENTEDSAATLQIDFAGIGERKFSVVHDATVYRPRYTTSNLIVSDGYPRRVFLRVELDSLAKDVSTHTSALRFHIVPGTLRGSGTTLILYIPDSTDPSTAEFKTGQRVTEKTIEAGDTTVEFPLANAIFLILQGTLKNNGFALRFADENTRLRQVELYGTDAPDSLRPKVFVISSKPAVFD